MQTYTHIPIGALTGAVAFPGQPLAQVVCIVAAILPDVVMIPTFVLDRIAGRQPLVAQPLWLLWIKEISHSLILSFAVLSVGLLLYEPLILALGLGWLSHVLVDIFTHGDPRFQSADPHYAWPLGSLRKLGRWDYRIKTGALWPVKPLEMLVFYVTTVGTLLVWSN